MCQNNNSFQCCGIPLGEYRSNQQRSKGRLYCLRTKATIVHETVINSIVPSQVEDPRFKQQWLPHMRRQCNMEHGVEFAKVMHVDFERVVSHYTRKWTINNGLLGQTQTDWSWNEAIITQHFRNVDSVEAWMRTSLGKTCSVTDVSSTSNTPSPSAHSRSVSQGMDGSRIYSSSSPSPSPGHGVRHQQDPFATNLSPVAPIIEVRPTPLTHNGDPRAMAVPSTPQRWGASSLGESTANSFTLAETPFSGEKGRKPRPLKPLRHASQDQQALPIPRRPAFLSTQGSQSQNTESIYAQYHPNQAPSTPSPQPRGRMASLHNNNNISPPARREWFFSPRASTSWPSNAQFSNDDGTAMDEGDALNHVKSETDEDDEYDGRYGSLDCGDVDDCSTTITGRSFASIPHITWSSGDHGFASHDRSTAITGQQYPKAPDDALASFSSHRNMDASNATVTGDSKAFSAHQFHSPHASNDNETVVTNKNSTAVEGKTFPGGPQTSFSPGSTYVSSHSSKAAYMAELIERGREADKRSYDTLMEQIKLRKEFGFLVFSASFTAALSESGDCAAS